MSNKSTYTVEAALINANGNRVALSSSLRWLDIATINMCRCYESDQVGLNSEAVTLSRDESQTVRLRFSLVAVDDRWSLKWRTRRSIDIDLGVQATMVHIRLSTTHPDYLRPDVEFNLSRQQHKVDLHIQTQRLGFGPAILPRVNGSPTSPRPITVWGASNRCASAFFTSRLPQARVKSIRRRRNPFSQATSNGPVLRLPNCLHRAPVTADPIGESNHVLGRTAAETASRV